MLPVHDFFILQGDYHGVFVVKDRVANEAMNVIADNTELAENFAETVKREIAKTTVHMHTSVSTWQTTFGIRVPRPKCS